MGIKARSSHYLVAIVSSTSISLLALPLITRILGPAAYGRLALAGTITGVGGTLATLGISFAISNRLPKAREDEAASLVSTLCLTAAIIVLVWVLLVAGIFAAAGTSIDILDKLPERGFYLLLIGTLMSPFWLISSEILTLQGRSVLFALVTIAQTLLTTLTTLAVLYIWNGGEFALYVGALVGNSVAFTGALVVLFPYLTPSVHGKWRRELSQGAFLFAQASDNAYPLIERTLFTRFAGFTLLGLYSHSERYRTASFLATKAIGRGAWPVMLEEARDPRSDFQITRSIWTPVHIAITVIGIAMVTNGDTLISLLTNDRFTEGYVFLAPWFLWVLLQNSARPQFATVYAMGSARTLATTTLAANLIAMAALGALVPIFNGWGAAAGLLVRSFSYRVILRSVARRYREVPFQDGWVLGGSALLIGASMLEQTLRPSPQSSLGIASVFILVCLLLGAKELRLTLRTLLNRDVGGDATMESLQTSDPAD